MVSAPLLAQQMLIAEEEEGECEEAAAAAAADTAAAAAGEDMQPAGPELTPLQQLMRLGGMQVGAHKHARPLALWPAQAAHAPCAAGCISQACCPRSFHTSHRTHARA